MRDSKMTVSNTNIWKSAASAVRQPHDFRGKNLHIGRTLRDLYLSGDATKTDGTFSNLLSELEATEKASGSGDH
jgi:hypothetical protein